MHSLGVKMTSHLNMLSLSCFGTSKWTQEIGGRYVVLKFKGKDNHKNKKKRISLVEHCS